MACTTTRYTSKDLVMEYLPDCDGVERAHVQLISIPASVSGGTIAFRINGVSTGAITYTGTPATDITAIETAIDAVLATIGDGTDTVTVTGTVSTAITVTHTNNYWYEYLVDEGGDLLTGNTSSDPNVTLSVTTQGAKLYRVSTEISEFSYSITTETTDVTAISEYSRSTIPVADTVSFDGSAFASNAEFEYIMQSPNGIRGIWTIYPQGKLTGQEIIKFEGLLTSFEPSYPDHDVVEISFSGDRVGGWILPPRSVY